MTMAAFEELDYSMTPLGELILRRREVLSLDRAEVFEVKLAGELLMSSIVNGAEIALAEFALTRQQPASGPCSAGPPAMACDRRDVLVGGLGLGYTAKAALDADNIASVTVIEYLERVIAWHENELVPLGRSLTQDARCRLVHGDFFAVVGSPANQQAGPPDETTGRPCPAPEALAGIPAEPVVKPPWRASKRFHVILLDIDHSPRCLLHAGHAAFYTAEGLKRLTGHIHPGGVFALWSADPPEESLTDDLNGAFESVQVRETKFYNPLLDLHDVNYIVVAQRAPGC